MYVSISDLVSHRQYTDFPAAYCFDRKTYSFCDPTWLSLQKSELYPRYIPLFQIDQHAIENAFLLNLHNRQILRKYNASNVCFEEFVQQNNLWRQWWDYYVKRVKQIAIHWCENNNINYRNE